MIRKLTIFNLFILFFLVQGCVSLKVEEKVRIDQIMNGNAGYVVGEPKASEGASQDLTRNMLNVGVTGLKFSNPWGMIKEVNDWVQSKLW